MKEDSSRPAAPAGMCACGHEVVGHYRSRGVCERVFCDCQHVHGSERALSLRTLRVLPLH